MPMSRRGSIPSVPEARAGEDPFAARSAWRLTLFRWYLHWFFWRRFAAVRVSRGFIPPDPVGRPVVIYTNHPSWWDPAMMLLVSPKLFPDRIGFGPMDEAALGNYGLFRRFGAFGVARDARGAARFLRMARAGLADPRAIMWVTAEGEFTDPRRRPLVLRPGIAHLARHVPDAVFMPAAFDYVFWNESRPEAHVRFGAPVTVSHLSVGEAGVALTAALTAALDGLAEDAAARDANRFLTLLHGAGGVSAIYDTWRRARAWRQGRAFDPRHEPWRP
jgi:1-acyl-sn-glycerol-3-phosphate acyltransferase